MRVVTLSINGEDVTGRDEDSILHVAKEHKIDIPTLCYLDGISAWGGCRLCLVHIEGNNKLMPACVTKVTEGMVIKTESERLANYRRMIVEMLYTEGNHICSVCVSNGHCELQDMAQRLGVDHISLPYRYPQRTVDASHKQFTFDPNRCILCTRCVRVCDEVEGAHTWDVAGRGIESRVIIDLDQPWGESTTCTSCGKCVEACPTGALYEKGKGAGEMVKHPEFLTYLEEMKKQKE